MKRKIVYQKLPGDEINPEANGLDTQGMEIADPFDLSSGK